METISNKLQKNKALSIDLEDFYPAGKRISLDISKWLYEGIVLKEKDFRNALVNFDWTDFKGTYVNLYCATDAVVPFWAYLLITTYLTPICKKVVVGSLQDLENILYADILYALDVAPYKNKIVVIKGCSKRNIPETAYVTLVAKLLPFARKILFGELCSAVPLTNKLK